MNTVVYPIITKDDIMGWHTFEDQGISGDCIKTAQDIVKTFRILYPTLDRTVDYYRECGEDFLLVTISGGKYDFVYTFEVNSYGESQLRIETYVTDDTNALLDVAEYLIDEYY